VRAGGKHNDLDQVGYTARHHTFFEMLGNFSFGDYFKREAIGFAWDLLTRVYGLAPERLWVTVYHSDDEAYSIWADEIKVPVERIIRIGDNQGAPWASDNFWQMADTGPCGPCSEVFYDHGPGVVGGPPGSDAADGDRYIEIWNLVFMQFDRAADGSLSPLPKPCVDTGMGLERLAAVLQGVHSNYEIDLFRKLIAAAAAFTATSDLGSQSLRVIADHIRACAFLIVDGVLPSNEGRGYVLRRIIRRALRHGWMLGTREVFFYRMLAPLIEEMGEAYPELARQRATIEAVLRAEEARFAETLDQGMRVFNEIAARSGGGVIAGDEAFRLYDTYGFPVDLTQDIARERDLSVDLEGFERAMSGQRSRARAASQFGGGVQLPAEVAARIEPSVFVGYDALTIDDAHVVAILAEHGSVAQLAAGEAGVVILDRTPFYAESGGQVGDIGTLATARASLQVDDTVKLAGAYHGHLARCERGVLAVGDQVSAAVEPSRRGATVLNHSATHLLHAALRQVLGEHVTQKGSLVAPDRLRFDFSHFQPLDPAQLQTIERMVNTQVRANAAADTAQMGFDEAVAAGAMALFGEKYGDQVRVLKFGDFSTELCGGTHVSRTGDIGLFRIVAESGVAAGVRRIEALTGEAALSFVAEREQQLGEAAFLLGVADTDVAARLRALIEAKRQLERELESLKARSVKGVLDQALASAQSVAGLNVLALRIDGLDAKALREAIDVARQKLGDAVVVLASGHDGKISLAAGVSGAALSKVKAGALIGHIAQQIGGKGGGRPDLAQGGGDDGPALAPALAAVPAWVAEQLENR